MLSHQTLHLPILPDEQDPRRQTDGALLHRFWEDGDPGAFGEIVRRYPAMVFSACHRVLGDRARSEDVSQETFFRLMQNPRMVRESLGGWLHQVATRLAIDARRSETARRLRELRYASETADQARLADRDARDWVTLSAQLDQTLEEMPAALRSILVAHFLQGKTQADLAGVMDASPATVSRRIREALAELHRRLRAKGVAVQAGVLAPLLYGHAIQSAPAVLWASLGKMAMLTGSGLVGLGGGAGGGHGASAASGKAAGVAGKMVRVILEPAASQATWGTLCIIVLFASTIALTQRLSRWPGDGPSGIGMHYQSEHMDAPHSTRNLLGTGDLPAR